MEKRFSERLGKFVVIGYNFLRIEEVTGWTLESTGDGFFTPAVFSFETESQADAFMTLVA